MNIEELRQAFAKKVKENRQLKSKLERYELREHNKILNDQLYDLHVNLAKLLSKLTSELEEMEDDEQLIRENLTEEEWDAYEEEVIRHAKPYQMLDELAESLKRLLGE